MSPGYQCVQTSHAVADFAYDHPTEFRKWKDESNYIICLAVENETKLLELYSKFNSLTKATLFFEPDVNEHTSFAMVASDEIRKKLSKLPLLLKSKPTTYV